MPAAAVLVNTQDRRSSPSATVPRSVHPAGVVAVALRLVLTNSSSWSPTATDAGTTTVGRVAVPS